MDRRLFTGTLFAVALVVTGCGGDDTADSDETTTSSTTTSTTTTTTTSTTASSSTSSDAATSETTQPQPSTSAAGTDGVGGCWVHLFEEENFDESDEHHRLSEPGRYADLETLPGAPDDWTDEAESIRVGPDATVTIWTDSDFEGQPRELAPGSQHPDLDDEAESLELTC